MITVIRATSDDEIKSVYKIRKTVFVEEQHVPEELEYDAHETDARHFLAYMNGIPCGACRWRTTADGAKLERFAVLKPFRRQGVASALIEASLKDIADLSAGDKLYLHAQVEALPFYKKFGFEPAGPMFEECGIRHFKMIRNEEPLQ